MSSALSRRILWTVAAAVWAAAAWAEDPKFKSGLQPGQGTSAFLVQEVSGPHDTKNLCLVCENGLKPVAMLFARKLTSPVTSLLKQFDAAVHKHKKEDLRSFAVFVTDDPEAMASELKELAKKEKISNNVPLAVFRDAVNPAGPAEFRLSTDAEVTVLLYTKNRVIKNFAYRPGELKEKDVKAIMTSIPKILPDERAKARQSLLKKLFKRG